MMNDERKIAERLVNRVIDLGYTISVYDGEEWTVKLSRDADEVLRALATTGGDCLSIRSPEDHSPVGRVWLVWGNGDDLVHDYSDNTITSAIVDFAQSH